MLKDLRTIGDLSADEITAVLDLASKIKDDTRPSDSGLGGELVLLSFTEPSTRTRITFSTAASRLGATVVVLGPAEFQRGCGASVGTIARMASLCANLIVARTGDHNLDELADRATIPVEGSSLPGIDVHVACPAGFLPDSDVVARAQKQQAVNRLHCAGAMLLAVNRQLPASTRAVPVAAVP